MSMVHPGIIWEEEGDRFWQQLVFPEGIGGSDRPMSCAWSNIGYVESTRIQRRNDC
jgi:hypothetical protein